MWSGLDGGVEFLLSWLSSLIGRLHRFASFGNSLMSLLILPSSSSDEDAESDLSEEVRLLLFVVPLPFIASCTLL